MNYQLILILSTLFGLAVFVLIASGHLNIKPITEKLNPPKILTEQPRLFQGPVPEGYDEQYFRETGITKPLEDSD